MYGKLAFVEEVVEGEMKRDEWPKWVLVGSEVLE